MSNDFEDLDLRMPQARREFRYGCGMGSGVGCGLVMGAFLAVVVLVVVFVVGPVLIMQLGKNASATFAPPAEKKK